MSAITRHVSARAFPPRKRTLACLWHCDVAHECGEDFDLAELGHEAGRPIAKEWT
jgi:hypothetical protein